MPQKQITKYQIRKINKLIKELPLPFVEEMKVKLEKKFKDMRYVKKDEANTLIDNMNELKSKLDEDKILTIKGYFKV